MCDLEHFGHPCSERTKYECHGCDRMVFAELYDADKGMCKVCASHLCHICRHLSSDVTKCEFCKELTCPECTTQEEEIYECTKCGE